MYRRVEHDSSYAETIYCVCTTRNGKSQIRKKDPQIKNSNDDILLICFVVVSVNFMSGSWSVVHR